MQRFSLLLAAALALTPVAADAQRFAREISDQDAAAAGRKSGELMPLDQLFSRASAAGRGEYLGVDFDQATNVYRFKFMRPNGAVVAVDVDGRTGRVLRTQ